MEYVDRFGSDITTPPHPEDGTVVTIDTQDLYRHLSRPTPKVDTSYSPEEQKSESAKHKHSSWKFAQWLKERVSYELYVTGEEVWLSLTPGAPGSHTPFFTILAIVVWTLFFVAMAMQYDGYKTLENPAAMACVNLQLNQGEPVYGPKALVRWINPQGSVWCYEEGGKFDAEYLIDWGARWDPKLRAQPQRWLTSSIVHLSCMHLFSNAMLFLVLSYEMEIHHGGYRIAPMWLLSAFGGNLLSSVVEDNCTVVAGASGGIYGLVGAFIAETMLNWKLIRRKLLRVMMIIAFIVLFIVSTALEGRGTSVMSHIGGLLYGVLLAQVLLPVTFQPPWKLVVKLIGIFCVLITTAVLLAYFYVYLFPNICCGCQ